LRDSLGQFSNFKEEKRGAETRLKFCGHNREKKN